MRIRTRKPLHRNSQLVYSATKKENPRHVTDTNAGNKVGTVSSLLQAVFGKREKETCLVD